MGASKPEEGEEMTDLQFRTDMTVELVQNVGDDLGIAKAAWISSKTVLPDDAFDREISFLEAKK